MKIIIVNKSDSTGGAAVVSFRLMMALRSIGVDARMLVAEKLTDSPYVELLAPAWRLKGAFLADRLRIALANGFDRSTLFRLDAAEAGIDISRHPLVKDADAVLLNWINQGVLSLRGIRRLADWGAKLIWTMHDMWNLTGLCHHAGACRGYVLPQHCGSCPLLGRRGSPRDLSHAVSLRKERLYAGVPGGIRFVAVSSWLAAKGAESTLLAGQDVSVIPNPFHLPARQEIHRVEGAPGEIRLIFGAARLDDEVKDFPTFIETLRVLKKEWPAAAEGKVKVVLYGGIRDASLIDRIPFPVEYAGMLRNPADIVSLYCRSDIVVSTSRFETLPGTLVEGQAYGCLPVTFGSGGQRDIVTDGETGLIVERTDDAAANARRMAGAIMRGAAMIAADAEGLRRRMYESVSSRFAAESVARAYLRLIER
ncbi:MAG: glycosyltransferase [Muribaculaceae bacterium]|nr:glycosyltransferase [Muribaculaceae bacterium]